MPDDLYITIGDASEAAAILREAETWLMDTARPMWRLEDLTAANLQSGDHQILVLWEGVQGIATLCLSFYDPFFWPEIPAGQSGFIHKLAIRRAFAGKGYAQKLIGFAKDICLDRGISCLRLDCDPHRKGLCAFYEKSGFVLKEHKRIDTPKFGRIDLAMYEMALGLC